MCLIDRLEGGEHLNSKDKNQPGLNNRYKIVNGFTNYTRLNWEAFSVKHTQTRAAAT